LFTVAVKAVVVMLVYPAVMLVYYLLLKALKKWVF